MPSGIWAALCLSCIGGKRRLRELGDLLRTAHYYTAQAEFLRLTTLATCPECVASGIPGSNHSGCWPAVL